MSAAKPTPAVIAAVRVLANHIAEACDVNTDDVWNVHTENFITTAEAVLQETGMLDLLAAARPLVAMTHAEALEKEHHGMTFMYCRCDVLNPCWDASYSATGWGEHGPGKHWGGGDACPECSLRAAIAKATGEAIHG